MKYYKAQEMMSEYSKEDITSMREFLIKKRNAALGTEFDPEAAVTYSHIIALLAEILSKENTNENDS